MSVRILVGDALEQLRSLPDDSVHCCVTSPPYWGLRDYGIVGQIGLEPDFREYIAKLVEVFREVRRALRPDGTLWLNLGDSYAGGGRGGNPQESAYRKQATNVGSLVAPSPLAVLKPKDLCGIPWRVAFALQEDGWYLRQDIIWSKPNPMPESVRDRCTKAHEYLFLLSKSERYWYDAEAIKEASITEDPRRPYTSDGAWALDGRPAEQRHEGEPRSFKGSQFDIEHQLGRSSSKPRTAGNKSHKYVSAYEAADTEEHRTKAGLLAVAEVPWERRNKRSVWTVATEPSPIPHFAMMPTALAVPCILAGCPSSGTVLDPFFGAGTTGLVADRLGRSCIGIELDPASVDRARRRIANDAGLFAEVAAE